VEGQGQPVNVRFACQATGCSCEVVLKARMIVREESRLYEYRESTNCPNCGHRLFAKHRPVGEPEVLPM